MGEWVVRCRLDIDTCFRSLISHTLRTSNGEWLALVEDLGGGRDGVVAGVLFSGRDTLWLSRHCLAKGPFFVQLVPKLLIEVQEFS